MRSNLRSLALAAALIGMAVAAAPAGAHRTAVAIEVLSVQATLAPDGRSVSLDLLTQCDRRATVLEARVSVSQAQASGEASFTPSCVRLPQVVGVTVPAAGASFQTGAAQVSARLVVRQGSTKEASDSASVRVRPSVAVRVADNATLESGGQALRIAVSVTCPVASNGRGGLVNVWQGQVAGSASFGPTPCDGLPHAVEVRIVPSSGVFQPGSAEAVAFASVEEGGDLFPGSDLRTVLLM